MHRSQKFSNHKNIGKKRKYNFLAAGGSYIHLALPVNVENITKRHRQNSSGWNKIEQETLPTPTHFHMLSEKQWDTKTMRLSFTEHKILLRIILKCRETGKRGMEKVQSIQHWCYDVITARWQANHRKPPHESRRLMVIWGKW